jgi:hypothetical protein
MPITSRAQLLIESIRNGDSVAQVMAEGHLGAGSMSVADVKDELISDYGLRPATARGNAKSSFEGKLGGGLSIKLNCYAGFGGGDGGFITVSVAHGDLWNDGTRSRNHVASGGMVQASYSTGGIKSKRQGRWRTMLLKPMSASVASGMNDVLIDPTQGDPISFASKHLPSDGFLRSVGDLVAATLGPKWKAGW